MDTLTRKSDAFSKRIHEIDFIRGLLMMLVIMDHLFWAFKSYSFRIYGASGIEFYNVIYQIFNFYWTNPAREVVRQLVLFGFIFVSGISSSFSKNNWKRAGLMLAVWMGLAIVTSILEAVQGGAISTHVKVDFNVIGVLAWSILIYCFVQNKSWKGILATGLILLSVSFVVIPVLEAIPGLKENARIPMLWKPDDNADWLPLFPYIFYFFLGAVVGKLYYADHKSLIANRKDFERPFCFVGRHAIWIYFAHEPIIMLIGVLALTVYGVH